jgi:hypothetical protein
LRANLERLDMNGSSGFGDVPEFNVSRVGLHFTFDSEGGVVAGDVDGVDGVGFGKVGVEG